MLRTILAFLCIAATCYGATDAISQLNSQRAARGLYPFIEDQGLFIGASRCADYRAARGMSGHTQNDFGFLPPGVSAPNAGCAAWGDGTFGACFEYSTGFRYAGAAWTRGANGLNFCQLFVSNRPSGVQYAPIASEPMPTIQVSTAPNPPIAEVSNSQGFLDSSMMQPMQEQQPEHQRRRLFRRRR